MTTTNELIVRLAHRFVGERELLGAQSNPFVLSMLKLDHEWPTDDAVPWCSAFVNFIAWLLRLPRSKSLAARSWLTVGFPVQIAETLPGDVVILRRGKDPQKGHVGFFMGWRSGDSVDILGGNQGNAVSVASFPVADIVGIRRLR